LAAAIVHPEVAYASDQYTSCLHDRKAELTAAKFFMFCPIPPLKSVFDFSTVAESLWTFTPPIPRLIVKFSSSIYAMAAVTSPAIAALPAGTIFWLFWRMLMPFCT